MPRSSWIAPAVLCLIAVGVRVIPLAGSGGLVNGLEYDGGVMLSATLHLLAGEMPFEDFIYLHPPGSLLLFAPIAMLAPSIGEQGALVLLRLALVIVGGVNTLLIGVLLRRFGLTAVVVGAGMYAVWPVVTSTERMVMLEPILNLCLLGALIAIRRSTRNGGAWVAGLLLGAALSVKYWAVIDVLIVGAVIVVRFGRSGLWRYLVGGLIGASVLALPFFLRAPIQMWQQTVVVQLTRPATDTTLADRINMLSAFFGAPELDRLLPWGAWAALWLGLLALAVLPIFDTLRSRRPPREWSEPVWWGLLALAHGVVLAASAVFYDHYATWLVAPVALTTGAATARVRRAAFRRAIAAASAVLTLAVLAPQFVARHHPGDHGALPSATAGYVCLWGSPEALIAANAAARGIAEGCDVYVDPFGANLVDSRNASADQQSLSTAARDQLGSAEAAVLPVNRSAWPFDSESARWFTRTFTFIGHFGDLGLWARVDEP